jgi:hypothetical protein
MIQRYDPLEAPDPQEWLALDEEERLELVEEYHRSARIRLPNLAAHAATHTIVENQIALADDTPARRTAERLMREGLDRHEAIHAIGMVLMEHLNKMMKMKAPPPGVDPNAAYFVELERLTAEEWRRAADLS